MNTTTLITVANLILTPLVTVATLWIRENYKRNNRRDDREDGFIEDLRKQVDGLETKLAEAQREIKLIRAELTRKDEEYLKLFKENTTLQAKYDVLLADHDKLRSDYDTTAKELASLKKTLKEA